MTLATGVATVCDFFLCRCKTICFWTKSFHHQYRCHGCFELWRMSSLWYCVWIQSFSESSKSFKEIFMLLNTICLSHRRSHYGTWFTVFLYWIMVWLSVQFFIDLKINVNKKLSLIKNEFQITQSSSTIAIIAVGLIGLYGTWSSYSQVTEESVLIIKEFGIQLRIKHQSGSEETKVQIWLISVSFIYYFMQLHFTDSQHSLPLSF